MFEWNTIMLGKLRSTNNIVNTYDEVSVLSSLSLDKMYMYVCVYLCVCICVRVHISISVYHEHEHVL